MHLPLLFILGACTTQLTPPPSLYFGTFPPEVISRFSLDQRILVEDAWKELRKGNGSKAEKYLTKLGIENPFYYTGLGYIYMLYSDYQQAELSFKAALHSHANLVTAREGLAQLYQKTGKTDLAFSELRNILRDNPDNTWAAENYEMLMTQKTQETLSEARTFIKQGYIENSRKAFLKTLYYSPKSPEAHMGLAEIYLEEGKKENALVHLKTMAALEPRNIEVLYLYANTLYETNKDAESLEVFEKIADISPGDKNVEQKINTLKNRLGIFDLPSQYDTIPTTSAITKEQMSAVLAIKLKDHLDVQNSNPPIITDVATSWAQKYILQMTSLGLMEVYPNHTFQPKRTVTRVEMAEILLRIITYLEEKGYTFIQQIPPQRIVIEDVSPDNLYYQPIKKILSYDIMSLSQDKKFHPNFHITGQEAIQLIDIISALIK